MESTSRYIARLYPMHLLNRGRTIHGLMSTYTVFYIRRRINLHVLSCNRLCTASGKRRRRCTVDLALFLRATSLEIESKHLLKRFKVWEKVVFCITTTIIENDYGGSMCFIVAMSVYYEKPYSQEILLRKGSLWFDYFSSYLPR